MRRLHIRCVKKINYFSHAKEKTAVCLVQLTNRTQSFSFEKEGIENF